MKTSRRVFMAGALRCGSGMGLIAVGAVCLAEAGEKSNSALPETVTVSRDVLLDHIYGGWVGMLIGGLEGLPHENKYNEKPRETLPDFKYLPDGARTDDDTDFEWTHLYFMDEERVCFSSISCSASLLHSCRTHC